MKRYKIIGMLLAATTAAPAANAESDRIETLKQQIVAIAETYQGQGDPDQSKQRSLEGLVDELVQENPMAPIKDRLDILEGTWKQVWGPYEYRKNDGSVDPTIGVDEIYQVVSADGYYYNVAPRYPKGDRSREQISLLRGAFELDKDNPNALRVRFTDYPGVEPRPTGMNIWELAPLAEAGTLPDKITIVPRWLVRLFFGGGTLEEVYTDHNLRLVYGSSRGADARRSLYVMTRVQ